MADVESARSSPWSRARMGDLISTVAAMAALLFLDGQIGPLSFTLRRAAALAVLAILAVWCAKRKIVAGAVEPWDGAGGPGRAADGSDGESAYGGGTSRLSSAGRAYLARMSAPHAGRRIAGWMVVIASLAVVARAPTVPVALVGFVVALAVIEIGLTGRSEGARSAAGLVPVCLSYVAMRLMGDLVPQSGRIADAVARGGSLYIDRVRGFDVHLSFTAIGGPAVGLAVLYLLWSVRRAGGIGRSIAAVVVPLAWFALLPAVTPEVAVGPIAAFTRGAYHGLLWLGVAGAVDALLSASPRLRVSRRSYWNQPTRRRGDAEEIPARSGAAAPGGGEASLPHNWHPRRMPTGLAWLDAALTAFCLVWNRSRLLPIALSGFAAALAGVCLVGTAFIEPAARRSVRVFNSGGLDWDRPVFGQFGAFSSGMFGLWPVYCRAEGYDFEVIDKAGNREAGVAKQTEVTAPAKAALAPKKGTEGITPSQESGRGAQVVRSTDTGKMPVPHERPRAIPDGALPPFKSNTGFQPVDEQPADKTPVPREPSMGGSDETPPPRNNGTGFQPVEGKPTGMPHVPQETIEPADLRRTQVLVLINSPKVWDERERRTILEFVASGGSLLVLGDHTDVFGLMRGFNGLLEPLGIQYRFDSAYKARASWRGCQAAAPDAVAWGWDDENPGVAVGASLELSGWARPLLVGRYGFSDVGARENVMGSYLGNYHYDPGERLGDVVLVATATYGWGRVVVWGDTSAFQGVSSYYPDVVGPMLAWLSRPAAWTERPVARALAALGLLAAIIWHWLVRGGAGEAAVIAVGLLVVMAVPWCLGRPHREARVAVADDMVLFDRSHLPATGHYNAKVNPVGPLYTNLLRSGFRVTEMKDWDPAAIAQARGIVFVAPQRSFTAAEVRDILKAEDRGKVVILTVGQPDSTGARRLLDAHGLALEPRPLGTVSSADSAAGHRERETHPRFLDAWPIVAVDGGNPSELPGVENVYRHGRDVVGLFRRTGKGGLLLISDTRFFSDMNVEDISGYWVGNLALIHELFQRYLGAEPDAVKPLFRSPEKPQ
jgi:hypothetical protein